MDADILFHYTTREGLIGILLSGCLWATDVRFLNDTVEFEYGRKLAIDKLLAIRGRLASAAHVREISEAIRAMRQLRPRVFAASLAVGGDLLSLWRGYCRARNGYAIGFARDALQRAVQRRGSRLECVVYSPAAQLECLDHVEASAVRQSGPDPDPRKFAKAYSEEFLWLAPFLKSPEFFEEGEWRIVPRTTPSDIKYRKGRNARIPYVSIPVSSGRRRLPIEVILVGPNPMRTFDERSVTAFCRSCGISVPVRTSAVPYRPK